MRLFKLRNLIMFHTIAFVLSCVTPVPVPAIPITWKVSSILSAGASTRTPLTGSFVYDASTPLNPTCYDCGTLVDWHIDSQDWALSSGTAYPGVEYSPATMYRAPRVWIHNKSINLYALLGEDRYWLEIYLEAPISDAGGVIDISWVREERLTGDGPAWRWGAGSITAHPPAPVP